MGQPALQAAILLVGKVVVVVVVVVAVVVVVVAVAVAVVVAMYWVHLELCRGLSS